MIDYTSNHIINFEIFDMIDYTSNHYIYDESYTIAYFNIIPTTLMSCVMRY
jgi:hypothetical protein